MMDYPLTVRTIYQRAQHPVPGQAAGDQAGRGRGGVRRTTYGDWAERVARLAGGCATWGSGPATGWRPSAGTTTGTWRCTSRPP